METLLNDIKHGVRLLARNPGFTLVVVLALALGIGANTVVFSVLNAVLLKPLPYHDPDKIVAVWMRFTGIGIPGDRNWTSPPEFLDLRRFSTAFSEISAMSAGNSLNIRVGEAPERIVGASVSANFFKLLGIEPQLGRTFAAEEESQGRDGVVILSHGLWQRRFGSDPKVIGRSIDINGRTLTIIGVAPVGFNSPPQTEAWTPLAFTDQQLGPDFRGSHGLLVLARIKTGLSIDQARADMDRVSQQIKDNAPQYPYARFNFLVLIRPLLEETVGEIQPALVMLMGAVALVLLIACANVANLLMVRASAREREIGIRTALGATRKRLVRQLLTESVILSFAGAAIGLAIAKVGVSAIASHGSQTFPRLGQTELDAATLAFTMTIALATGIFFGIVPALQVSQASSHESLKEGGRAGTTGSARQRLRRLLVIGEVALSLALLSGAGLLIKSFMRLQDVDPGFKPEGVLTMRVVLPPARYDTPGKVRAFFRDFMDRVSKIPGVQSVGGISALPLSGAGGSGTTTVDTAAVPPDRAAPEADRRAVTPGYFETVGTQLIEGRYFDDYDNETSARVAIVDETMAKAYWPNESAIGKRVKFGGQQSTQPWMTIVGVVKHTRYLSLERPSRVQLYWPQAQVPGNGLHFAVRTAVVPATIVSSVQHAAMDIDPDQPVFGIRPMTELIADSVMRRRLVMLLLAIFAGVALVLAALGIYGVVSYWVTQRSHEIGIRIALGASRSHVLNMVIGQSLAVVVAGVIIGLLGSLALTRLITALLFNVTATDPSTFALVSACLLAIGLAASAIPALRALQVDPVHTLRQE